MLIKLEAGIKHFAAKTHKHLSLDIRLSELPGTGAAGGMGYSLMAYTSASMESGFDIIAKLASLDKIIDSKEHKPDLIITGEGCFDAQSLNGKLVGQIKQYSEDYEIPMLVICGVIGDELNMHQLNDKMSVFSLCNDSVTQEHAIKNPAPLLENLISQKLKFILN